MNIIESNKGEIILYQPDETIRLEVRMGEDTVWLTQLQMAELFNKDRTDIGRHIRNIYKEEELERDITCAKFAHMGTEGDQQYEYTAYNLDVIISVGYRVKSRRGTKFRQWANKVLKEYLLRGYVVNTDECAGFVERNKMNKNIYSSSSIGQHSAMKMKIGNFGRLDPTLKAKDITGLEYTAALGSAAFLRSVGAQALRGGSCEESLLCRLCQS